MGNKKQRILIHLLSFLTIFLFIFALSSRVTVHENKSYYSKNEVALYIYKYDKLPNNYISIQEAESTFDSRYEAIENGYNLTNGRFHNNKHSGYKDYIGNYEKITNSTVMYECDIYSDRDKVIKSKNRLKERLVFSYDDNFVYYTNNHYGQNEIPGFHKISQWSINKTSNVSWILFGIVLTFNGGAIAFYIFIKKDKKDELIYNIKYSLNDELTLAVILITSPFYLLYEYSLFLNKKIKIIYENYQNKKKV